MRSEAEIRKQVETRLRRWSLLALNGILWIGVAKLLFVYSQTHSFYGSQSDIIALVMLGWVALVGLHTLRTIYVELREYLVRRAIRQEHERYADKPKRDETRLTDDGELVDFASLYDDDEQIQYKPRS